MNQLTPEQIKTLEAAFASYQEKYKTKGKYMSMEGIQEQLNELNGKPGVIFYISKMIVEESGQVNFIMEKMIPGITQDSSLMAEDHQDREPTDNEIQEYMKDNNENYYTAREALRERVYGGKYDKPVGQSWGDYWKSY